MSKWISRVESRLEEIGKRPSAHFATPATERFLDEARGRIADSKVFLEEATKSLSIGTVFELKKIRHDLLIAEAAIGPVDYVVIPFLRSRTRSDPRYERVIARLLDDLNIKGANPLTSHHSLLGPLAVDRTMGHHPIFVFSPANRSLLTLCLLFHEIGHWVFADLLSHDERDRLLQEIRKFAGKRVDSTELALHEIAADVFAGLVGGYSYSSSLCCFLLGQQSLLATTNVYYPSPDLRIQFARWAARHAGDPDADQSDPLFNSWDFFVEEARKRGDRSDRRVSAIAAADFTIHFAEVLVGHGIVLSDKNTSPITIGDEGPRIDFKRSSVPTILRAACRYRTIAEDVKYWNWEIGVLHELKLVDGKDRSFTR